MILSAKPTHRLNWCLFLITLVFCSFSAQADLPSANDWLSVNSAEVSVSIESSIATADQAESEALTTLEQLNITPRSELITLRERVLANESDSTEALSRAAAHKAAALESNQTELNALAQRASILDSLVPGNVGLGTFDYYQGKALETAWALLSLASNAEFNSISEKLLSALLEEQRSDGSFGDDDISANNLYVTSLALQALQGLRVRYSLEEQITNASDAIEALQQANGSWGGAFETSVALISLVPASGDADKYNTAIEYLKSTQDTNGSWQNDVYVTAIAARAIFIAENISDSTTDVTGTASATVVDAATGQPLNGVTAEIKSFNGGDASAVEVVSDLTGSLQFNELAPQQYTVTLRANEYLGRTIEFTVSAGQTINLGEVALSKPISSITGIVKDFDTGAAVENALVTVTGSANVTAITNVAGAYQVNAPAGQVSIEISATGFDAVSGQGVLSAGGTLTFSPLLRLKDTTPVNTKSNITGRVLNQSTGEALNGASIVITETGIAESSGSDGTFEFFDLEEGTYAISISNDGYSARTISIVVPEATTLSLGDIGLLEQSEPLKSSVTGRVVEADTSNPLEGVMVNLGDVTSVTGPDGTFTFLDLDAGDFQVTLSKVGYRVADFAISLDENTSLQLTDIPLGQEAALTESSLSGKITDAVTGEPVIGAEILLSTLGLTASTDSQGEFTITGISELEFQVTVSASGYFAKIGQVTSDKFENIEFSTRLQKAASISDVAIVSVDPDRANYQSYEQVDLAVIIENSADRDINTVLYIKVTDSTGKVVEERAELTVPVGGSITDTYRTALAGQETEFEVLWFTQGLEADDYTATIQAFSADGTSLLSENFTTFTIDETNRVSGQAKFDPPLAQLAARTPIELSTSIMNRGNVDISAGTLTARVVVKNLDVDQSTAKRDLQIKGMVDGLDDVVSMDSDSAGNTYVVSRKDNTIIKISAGGSTEVLLSNTGLIRDIDVVGKMIYALASATREIKIYDEDLNETSISCSNCSAMTSIEVMDDKRIFVTNRSVVYEVLSDGSLEQVASSGVGASHRDMVRDSKGDLYLSDLSKDLIFKFSNGKLEEFIEIDGAHGLAIDSLDNLYVTTLLRNGAGQLLKVNLDTKQVEEIANGLNEPYDVHIESGENSFLVTNKQTHEILRITSLGEKTVLRSGTINSPKSLIYNPTNNRLIVSNTGFRDIREFISGDTTRTLAQNLSAASSLFYDSAGALNYLQNGDVYRVSDSGVSERIIDSNLSQASVQRYGNDILLSDRSGRFLLGNSSGEVSTFAETVLYFDNSPSLIVDGDGALYTLRRNLSANLPASIVKIAADDHYEIMPLGSTKTLSNLVRSSGGEFYFLNTSDRKLEQYQEGGSPVEIAQLDFRPETLTFDEIGSRFVISESGSNKLHMVDLNTGSTELFVTMPRTLRSRSQIVVGSDGLFWGIDSQNVLFSVTSDGSIVNTYSDLGRFSKIAKGQNQLYGLSTNSIDVFKVSFDGLTAEKMFTSQSFRSVTRFVAGPNDRLHGASSSFASSALLTFSAIGGEKIRERRPLSGVSGFVTSNDRIIAVGTNSVFEVIEDKVPEVLFNGGYQHISETIIENEYIVATRNKVFRLNIETKSIEQIVGVFQNITSLAVSANGEIAIADSSLNRITIYDNSGVEVDQKAGIVNPKGIAVDGNGRIVFANSSPGSVSQLENNKVEPYSQQSIINVLFVNTEKSTGEIYLPQGTSLSIVDPNTRNVNKLFFGTEFQSRPNLKGNLFYDGRTAYAVGKANDSGSDALLSLNFETKETKEFTSGLGTVVDIESMGTQLFALDTKKAAVLEIFDNGSSLLKFNDINLPNSLYISEDKQFHVGFGINQLAVFGDDREDFNFTGLVDGRSLSALTFVEGRYYLTLGMTNQAEIFIAEFDASSAQTYSQGDVLFSTTTAIDVLSVDTNAVKFNFGSWTPPISGDFVLEVSHSKASGTLMNSLHIGGSAQGAISLSGNAAFPGDRSINGSLQVIGADFTTISEIDTDSIALAAESFATGRAIAGDSKGNIYAASRNELTKVAPDGQRSIFAEGFLIGNSLAVDDSDNVYAVSGSNVMKISPAGNVSILATLSANAEAVFVDYDNDVYAADNVGVYKISQTGDVQLFKSINGTKSLSRDRYGNTYILNFRNRIFKVLPDGSTSPYFSEAGFEFEGVNMVNDCSDNVLFAPVRLEPFKPGGEEDIIVQVGNTTREPSQIFFGPEFDRALADIDVLYYDRINQQMLMYSDVSRGKIFSFPIICGGIDVDVTVVTRSDVDLSSSSPAPTTEVDLGGGQTKFVWSLNQVANSGSDIQLKYRFRDLVVGESRPALQEAYLEFSNTFVPDETIKVPLAVPSITVEQPVALTLKLDKEEYAAFERVDILSNVINETDALFNGSLSYKIFNDQDELVIEFDTKGITDLAAFEDRLLTEEWNTEQTLVGNYKVVSTLFDARGNKVTSASDTFSIVDNAGVTNVGLRLTADRGNYNINDSVQLDSLISNESLNKIERATELELSVTDVNGVQVFAKTLSTGDLTSSYSNVFVNLFELANAQQGEYSATANVLSQTGQVLASDATTFTVEANLSAIISGTVQVSASQVDQGEALICTDTLTNTSSIDLEPTTMRQLLIRIDDEQLIQTVESEQGLLAEQSLNLTRDIDTSSLQAGIYACAIQAVLDSGVETLATEFFEVLEAQDQLQIELSASIGSKGRVLVLLDDSSQCTDDPYGPRNTPDLATQQALLESVLSNAGWSYTITLKDEDFLRELRTGGYSSYVLLAEIEGLSHFSQKELREAVYRGEGLIEAGKRLNPQDVINNALGIQHRGHQTRTTGFDLLDSELGSAASATFIHRDRNVRITARSAQVVAEYMNGQSAESNHHSGRHWHGYRHFWSHSPYWCPPIEGTSPAITLNEFGLGQAVYMGFDLLSEASSMGDAANIFSSLLLSALDTVNPDPSLTTIGTDYPVVFTVTNTRSATPAQFVLPVPENVSVVDAGQGVVNDSAQTITWSLDLAEGDVIKIPVWVEMPAETTLLSGSVVTGEPLNSVEQASASIELVPEALMSFDDVIDSIGNSRTLYKVKRSLQYARWYQHKGYGEHALRSLLIAAHHVGHIQTRYESENLTALRVNIGLLIRQTSTQLTVTQEHHRCVMRGQWPRYQYPSYPSSCRYGHWKKHDRKMTSKHAANVNQISE